ncbi:MAG: DUF4149 domain-containing protein [Candidatus Methylomirabilia bacterium]
MRDAVQCPEDTWTVDLFVRWVHVLAAVVWLGGMLFIALVLVPVARGIQDPALRSHLIGQAGRRFRTVGWVALGLLLVTGVASLSSRPWLLRFRLLHAKLALVLVALILSVVHDFILGPRVTRLPPKADGSRRLVSVLARVNVLVVLTIVLLGLALSG